MGRLISLVLAAATGAVAVTFSLVVEVRSEGTCLIGNWEPVGNGAVEWMRRNAPGMQMSLGAMNGVLELKTDGSYTAGGRLSVAEKQISSAGETRAQAEMEAHSVGRWSIGNGTLTLSPTRETMSGQMQIVHPDGSHHVVPMPSAGAMGPTQYQYVCSGDRLETQMHFPGMADPMIQSYTRVGTTGN